MSSQQAVVTRPATAADLDGIAPLAAALVRLHHHFDALRFMLIEPIEEGYKWWLGRELQNPNAVVLVAELDGAIAGYCYGRMQERDWNALLEACGSISDIYVAEAARRRGVARQLTLAMARELEKRGAPRVVLSTAWPNSEAQALFKSLGFRPTMIEMTREAGGGDSK